MFKSHRIGSGGETRRRKARLTWINEDGRRYRMRSTFGRVGTDMVKVIFISSKGQRTEVDAKAGDTLKNAAVENKVPEIEAACGGAMVCGTCHAYIAEPFFAKLPPAQAGEQEMLDYGLHVQPNSRLCCQVKVTEDLDGMVVNTPIAQH